MAWTIKVKNHSKYTQEKKGKIYIYVSVYTNIHDLNY